MFERWGRLGGEPWVIGWIVTTALNIVRRSARRTPELVRDTDEGPSSENDVEGALDLRRAIRTGCAQARPGTEPFVPIVSIHPPFAEHMLPRVIS